MGGFPCPPGFLPGVDPGSCDQQTGDLPFTVGLPPKTATIYQSSAVAVASIDQSIQIVNQDVQPLADAVSGAISAAAKSAQDTAASTVDTINKQVGAFADGLFGWAKDVGKWLAENIGKVLEDIGSKLKDVASAVYNTIKDAVTNAVKAIADTIGPVIETIGKDITRIVDFYQQHIQPILETISQVEKTVSAAVVAIQADLKSGLDGLLRLPTDLSNAISGVDQALIRAGIALRVKNLQDADVQWIGSDGKSITEHIKGLGAAVTGLGTQKYQTTYAPGKETLAEPDLAHDLDKVIKGLNAIIVAMGKGVWKILHNPVDTAEGVVAIAGGILAEAFEPNEVGRFLWEIMRLALDIPGELAAEEIRKLLPLSKLDPSTLAAAWRRNLITKETMDEESLLQGYNGDRTELLRRLTTYVPDIPILVDWLYRGLIEESDFHAGLSVLGVTDADIGAIRSGSVQLLGIADALTAYNRGEIDEATLQAAFKANRYADAERELITSLSLRPPNTREAYTAYLIDRFLDDYADAKPIYETIPQSVRAAGKAEGLSNDAVLSQWTASVNTLDAGAWLQLYWRGEASLTQLQVALRRDRVPDSFVQYWIDAQRPLIPFRTIPSMVAAGILTQADALARLQGHGYSLADATKLLEYALKGHTSPQAATAAAQKDVSTQQAKLAYQDGLYTKEQYHALLLAHGMTETAATLEISIEDISAEAKKRKQIATDIVNEFQAGLIDQAAAVQQLADSGLTLAEQAAAQRRLKSAKAVKAKMPTESELRAMATKDIITVDDYQSNLVTLGFAPEWAQRFRDLHFPTA